MSRRRTKKDPAIQAALNMAATTAAPLVRTAVERLVCPTAFVLWLWNLDGPEFVLISNTSPAAMDEAMEVLKRSGYISRLVVGTTLPGKARALRGAPRELPTTTRRQLTHQP